MHQMYIHISNTILYKRCRLCQSVFSSKKKQNLNVSGFPINNAQLGPDQKATCHSDPKLNFTSMAQLSSSLPPKHPLCSFIPSSFSSASWMRRMRQMSFHHRRDQIYAWCLSLVLLLSSAHLSSAHLPLAHLPLL